VPRSAGTQQPDQIEPVHSRHILVDSYTTAEVEVAGAQQLSPDGIVALMLPAE
jgi:hypothetical protein